MLVVDLQRIFSEGRRLQLETQVLIIGAGATGTGLARDLALRGVHCIIAEQADVNAGASGSNHGLLHSGARYVSGDPETAKECHNENILLKHLAPHCIEDTGGLFVAVEGDDETYIADFPHLCNRCGLPYEEIDVKDAREQEPALSEKTIVVYKVLDATLDPFKLSLENLSHAQQLGAVFMPDAKIVSFKSVKNRITEARLYRKKTGQTVIVYPEQVVSASGAWAGKVAALAGASVEIIYSKGSLLVSYSRITERVINRLHLPADGDILVPGGTVSLLGTTSVRIDSLEDIRPTIAEIDRIVTQASYMIPVLASTRYTRAYAGVRPLIEYKAGSDDRTVSRGFSLLDHSEAGLENFVTISGGKLTTYRLMAEKTADLVCDRLGVSTLCRTRTEPLPADPVVQWTVPGLAPRLSFENYLPGDIVICECEMVPRSALDHILDSMTRQNIEPSIRAVTVRSRMGKGPCQGAFCGLRMAAHMYDRETLRSDQGLDQLRSFFNERWKGQHPVLWGGQLIQVELSEAIHCGFLGLELDNISDSERGP